MGGTDGGGWTGWRSARARAVDGAGEGRSAIGAAAVAELLAAATVPSVLRRDRRRVPHLDALVRVTAGPAGREALDVAVAAEAGSRLAGLWEDGWQPTDVVRQAGRGASPLHASMAVDLVARQVQGLDLARAPRAWLDQLDALGARLWWASDAPHLHQWARREGLTWDRAVGVLTDVLGSLLLLPSQAHLCPPPSRWSEVVAATPTSGGLDPKVVTKVRALVAKAESTAFEAEAEALMAKAQELIARHSIDRALLEADAAEPVVPAGRRIPIDDPYAAGTFTLLARIAAANRCRAVWSRGLGTATLVGQPADLDAVELLHASLLVQAVAAMAAAGRHVDELGVTRTRSFRSSFLTAFAHRIGQRLSAATASQVQEAAQGDARLLPVLAAREEAVDRFLAEAFPRLVTHRSQPLNRAGVLAGRMAADAADLAAGRLGGQRRLGA